MNAVDFKYDGQFLSDYGFIICDFNGSNGLNEATTSSKISFETVPMLGGRRYSLVNAKYDEALSFQFDICKNPEVYDDLFITSDEYRDLMRWLNRDQFLELCLFDNDEDYDPCYFNASFNAEKLKIGERVCGVRLYAQTDSPYALGEEITITKNFYSGYAVKEINDMSDEIGFIYPSIKITCKSDGDLTLSNLTYDVDVEINNCINNEVITIDGESLTITTDNPSHSICDDFNYEFFVIGNTMNDRRNRITTSIPCLIEIKYRPIIKDLP